MRTLDSLTAGLVLVLSLFGCAQEQYPKPLEHTAANHPAARVLLLSINGLHAFDLANWIAAHPHSAFAELSARGVTYTNAHAPMANPAAGLLALVTGGTPISTGIVGDDGYDRALSSPGSLCRSAGTELPLDRATLEKPIALDPKNGCKPLAPHDLVRVNTIFEIVREKVGATAWAGENPKSTDLLRGPSGNGLSQACDDAGGDRRRVEIVLHWIDGATVPALFGMSFTSVAEAQAEEGYVDSLGTPSRAATKSLNFVDDSIGRIVRELKTRHLFDSTWIAITSPYAQSPVDRRTRVVIPLSHITDKINAAVPGGVIHVAGGTAAMIWLANPAEIQDAARALNNAAPVLGIDDIYAGGRLGLTFNPPSRDSRMPDIILQARAGVIWASAGAEPLMSFGGMLDQDTHVALMISGPGLTGRSDPTYVPTTQLAPLLLRALGMEKFDLRALHLEHSPALPGIF